MKLNYPVNLPDYTIRRFVRTNFPHLSQAAIHKSIRTGDILVNGKKANIDQELNQTDCVNIWDKLTQPIEPTYLSQEHEYKFLKEYIIKRTPDYWVINKPAGLAMQGGSNIKTSLDYLLSGMMDKGDQLPHLVHRLDRYTSGVCLVATSSPAAFALSRQFVHRKMKKTYIALCHNNTGKKLMLNHEGQFSDPLDGKDSVTNYRIAGVYKDTFVIEFKPLTGRKHQIRQHASMHNLPICGDQFYYPETNYSQIHLHSYILEHTIEKGDIPTFTYKAPFPKHMQEYEQFFL